MWSHVKYFLTLFLPAFPIFLALFGSSRIVFTARTIADEDLGSITMPQSSVMISGIPPTDVPITGFSIAIASTKTIPNGS